MLSICQTDCCSKCSRQKECGGCRITDGHPFGGTCIAAESIRTGGLEEFIRLKNKRIAEINTLGIEELKTEELYLLNGCFVNLEYRLPNGQMVRFLQDNDVYLGCQIERTGSDRCYGVVTGTDFLLVCTYGCGGSDPELLLYKKKTCVDSCDTHGS